MSTRTLCSVQVSWRWIVRCDTERDATGRSLEGDPGPRSSDAPGVRMLGTWHNPQL